MNCTHPVLYHNAEGALVCHICGAVVAEPLKEDKSPVVETKPAEAKKTGRKRKADQGE